MTLPPRLPLGAWLVGSSVAVLALPVVALLGTGALAWDLVQQTREDLEHQGALLAMIAEERMGRPERMSEMLAEAKTQTLAGIRIVDDAGVVVASSGDDVGADLSDDAEVRTALAGSKGLAIKQRDPVPWRSRSGSSALADPEQYQTRHADVRVFVAVPVRKGEDVLGAVVLSRTPREEWQTFWQMAPRLSGGGLAALLLAAGSSLFIGWRASRSLRLLARVSERLSAGQVDEAALDDAKGSRILETARLAEAMGTMAALLRARMAYITEFAGNVSHEFKTPVSSLRGTIELLRDDDGMPPEQRARFLDNALGDLDRLSNLVGGLLRLARAEEGGERAPVDLDGVAQGVVRRHAGVALTGSAGTVLAAEEQLAAVLENLVANARRHGGPTVRVEAWRRGGRAGFDVVDDGAGIDPRMLGQLFDRFFTTDRERGGTGLGLALVRTVCERHGGGVSVASRPGETRFTAWVDAR